ncbi:msh6 [Ecytonucleospora hepatopenaei]|uniref:Msh6 n=1 Tax=Ecytonucleospora hepatopenaei TaxID=646526 RepID=A0A1W0E5V9_9MICR|nr:msh6 [Ecytonucleospora hepatopenaei]
MVKKKLSLSKMLKSIAERKNTKTIDSFLNPTLNTLKTSSNENVGNQDFTNCLTQKEIENTDDFSISFEKNKVKCDLNKAKTDPMSNTLGFNDNETTKDNFTITDEELFDNFDTQKTDKNMTVEEKLTKNNTGEILSSPKKFEYLINGYENEVVSETRFSFLKDIKDKNGKKPGEAGYNSGTLFISTDQYSKLKPFERQYWEIKSDLFDTVVFIKMGKFYELYENDALLARKLFDLRVKDRANGMKLAGVPDVQYDVWAAKFLAAGYKVARVDERESLLAKKMRERDTQVKEKIIERKTTEIVTPSTIYNHEYIKSPLPFYLGVVLSDVCCMNFVEECDSNYHYSVLLYDSSVNFMYTSSVCDNFCLDSIKTLFTQYDVREVITNCAEINKKTFRGLAINPVETVSLELKEEAGMLYKIKESKESAKQMKSCVNVLEFENTSQAKCFLQLYRYFKGLLRENVFKESSVNKLNKSFECMQLDAATIVNMDILVNNFDNTVKHSLFDTVNCCTTPFGVRKLYQWILHPLCKLEKIKERREKVNMLKVYDRAMLINILKEMGDIERAHCKLKQHKVSLKDLKSFINASKQTIKLLENILEKADTLKDDFYSPKYFHGALKNIISDFEKNFNLLDDHVEPVNSTDELFIVLNEKIEIEKQLCQNIKRLSEFYGDVALNYKNVSNDIFQIECSKEDFEEKISEKIKTSGEFEIEIFSKTKFVVRFYTKETKKLVLLYKEAEEKIFQAKNYVLTRAVKFFAPNFIFYKELVDYIATLDCYLSFSLFNGKHSSSFSEPHFIDNFKNKNLQKKCLFSAVDVTNPIYQDYVTNDFNPMFEISLLTGPNMGGKSTFLRSICLNIILAQMGLNVAAKEMHMPIYDQIFTRIGASDSLAKNESTFMMEMNECSKILKNATNNSFVILDELGRGTSTRDGEAIARAVLIYLNKIGCFTLFSTHYHRLMHEIDANKEESLESNRYFMSYSIEKEDVIFKYKLKEGISDESHGIYVARLAGVPEEILEDAKKIKEEIVRKNLSF